MAWSICKVFIDVTKVSTLTIAPKIRVLSFIHVKMGGIILNRKFKFQCFTPVEPYEPFIVKVSRHTKPDQGTTIFWSYPYSFGFSQAFGLSALQSSSGRYP